MSTAQVLGRGGQRAGRPSSRIPLDDARREAPETDRELVEAIADGGHAAFAVLYGRMAGPMLGIALRTLKDRALAEDATHEAFMEVWKHAGRFDADRGSVRTWVAMLVHGRAVDRVRNEQARSTRQTADAALQEASPTRPDEVAVDADERASIGTAMNALTPRQRESVELAFYEGLTHPEIARHLDVPLGTVKSRINGGLGRLRAAMDVTT